MCDQLRRVGAGAATVHIEESQGELVLRSAGLLFVSVPGKQTVPRAENHAGARSLLLTSHCVQSWLCDASYTVKGSGQGSLPKMIRSQNGDVWLPLSEQLARSRRLEDGATKVKAHQTLAQVRQGSIAFKDYIGNGLADIGAGLAAECNQQQQPVVESVQKSFATCVLLNLRLAAIEAHVWQTEAKRQVPVPVLLPLPVVQVAPVARL